MQLPGWQHIPGTSRYTSPEGESVSRRSYLNAQARSVGWDSYSQFQREINRTMYRQAIATAADPKAARKLDSAFSSHWAKNILPRLETSKRIGRDMWSAAFFEMDMKADTDLYVKYAKKE